MNHINECVDKKARSIAVNGFVLALAALALSMVIAFTGQNRKSIAVTNDDQYKLIQDLERRLHKLEHPFGRDGAIPAN